MNQHHEPAIRSGNRRMAGSVQLNGEVIAGAIVEVDQDRPGGSISVKVKVTAHDAIANRLQVP